MSLSVTFLLALGTRRETRTIATLPSGRWMLPSGTTRGKTCSREEYVERGLAALRASLVMMYAPENPRTREQWERRHPFFGPEDYGFTMESYGHDGRTSPEGEGMGMFTIFDWGNGAAAEAYNRIVDHFGVELVHRGSLRE